MHRGGILFQGYSVYNARTIELCWSGLSCPDICAFLLRTDLVIQRKAPTLLSVGMINSLFNVTSWTHAK